MAKNLTINWRGKEGHRGLTEYAVEKMRKFAAEEKNDSILKEADELWSIYDRRRGEKDFTNREEIALVSEYMRVCT